MSDYQLTVLEGEDKGKSFPLEGDQVILGRPGSGYEGAIEFEDLTVSRIHAVLVWIEEAQTYELSNRSFTNPVRVNGEPAVTRVRLASGTQIQLGHLVAEFRLLSAGGEGEDGKADLAGYLEHVRDGRLVARHPVRRRRTMIGRSSSCGVVLDDTAVSRHHAVFEWFDHIPALYNVSANSTTQVNGQGIPKGASLGPRDEVLLGGTVLLRWIPLEFLAKEEENWKALEAARLEQEQQARTPGVEVEKPAVRTQRGAAPPFSLRVRDFFLGAPLRSRVIFFRMMKSRLENRGSIAQAVEEAGTSALPRLVPYLLDRVDAGMGLAETLSIFPGTFGLYEDGMVRAGEESGTMETQLGVLVTSLEEAIALREALVRRLGRALLWAGLAIVVATLPILWKMGALRWLVTAGLTLGAGALLGLLLLPAFHMMATSLPLRQRAEAFLAGTSRYGPALRLQAGARFLGVLGTLLSAGLYVPRAALIAARCSGSLFYGTLLLESTEKLSTGSSVREALSMGGFLSPEVLDQIDRGEEEGRLPEVLIQASNDLGQQARLQSEAVVSGLLRAALGLVVLLLLFGLTATRLLTVW